MKLRRYLLTFAAVVGVAALLSAGGVRLMRAVNQPAAVSVPAAPVSRTTVTFTVSAAGALQGGNSKMLSAPMTGSGQLILTELRKPGEMVNKDEVVARFDTTEEDYKLREAESDLAEAGQQVLQARSETLAREEELNAELLKARADVRVAEIECKRNPLLAAIAARQNDLALEGARDRLAKIERDYPQRKAAASASVAIQEEGRKKAAVQAETARRNIENMTLKAPVGGYVNIESNTNSNWFFPGMTFPLYQVGDAVRPGMAVAQIPDLNSWEVTARIAEQDRGYISNSQSAAVTIVALPGRSYRAKVTNLGGTTGPPWNRRFECKLALENPSPELRPGMSARIVIETGRMESVLAIPAQALFERDGKPYVFLKNGQGYSPRDIKLVRRSESQAVIEGLAEGQLVALASPDQKTGEQDQSGSGATKAIAR
jgi:biotin carboxyl carrier protein